MSEPRAFESLTEDHNQKATQVGLAIYELLQKHYPECNTTDRDLIMNSLCVALVAFIHQNVDKDNHPIILQVIHKILTNNLQKSCTSG